MATEERNLEILDYKIARAAEQIEFYEDHGLSQKKIDKLIAKKDRHDIKKVKDKKKKK